MTLNDLAGKIPFGVSMISKVERATRVPKRDFVDALESVFCTNGALLRRWSAGMRSASDPDWYTRVTSAERDAAEIRIFHSTVVPGRFQTEEYARAVLRDCRPLDPSDKLEEVVRLRMKLLPALLSGRAPAQRLILPEAVVRNAVGGAVSLGRQLEHLIELAESRTIRLTVLPADLPNHAWVTGPFRVITFTDRLPLAYVEHASGGVLIDGSEEVHRLSAIFNELQAWSMTPDESLELMKKVRGDLLHE